MGETIDTNAVSEQEYAVLLKILRKQNLKQTEEALKREAGISLSGESFRANREVIPNQYHQGYDRKSPINFAATKIVTPKQSAQELATVQEMQQQQEKSPDTREPHPTPSPPRVDSTTTEEECQPVAVSPLDKSPSALQQPQQQQQRPIPMLSYPPTLFQPSLPLFYPFSAPLLGTRFPLLTMLPVTAQSPVSMIPQQQQPSILTMATATAALTSTTPSPSEESVTSPPARKLSRLSSTSSMCESPCIVPASATTDLGGGNGIGTLECQDSEVLCDYTELRKFADDFKARRIRLGYTQGGVGQSLSDKGFCNFAQSTISRFEQMQLSHRNATTIKRILEKWLLEMENPHMQLSSTEKPSCRKRKRRIVFSAESKEFLDNMFRCNPKPDRHMIEMLSKELSLLPEEVRIWFCNKRQKERNGDKHDSLSSFTCPSPKGSSVSSSGDSGTRSPSPPSNFSIEELSKSSSNSPASMDGAGAYSPVGSPCYQVLHYNADVCKEMRPMSN